MHCDFLRIKFFVLITSLLICNITQAQHIWWNDPGCGDIMEIMVRVSDTAPTTYYETLGWNQGVIGGGYTGIQTHPEGSNYIFSLWDPIPSSATSITAAYVNPAGYIKQFGGEGTGLRYINYATGWKLNQWYRQIVRSWTYHNHTYFGMWSYDVSANQWMHHVTMDFPVPNINFCAGAMSFLENWTGQKPNRLRRVNLTGGWKRTLDGKWIAFNVGNVSGDLLNYKMQMIGLYPTIQMQTGAYTTNTRDFLSIDFANLIPPYNTIVSPSYFNMSTVSLDKINQKTLMYTWEINSGQNPQFAYQVKLVDQRNNTVLLRIEDINPDLRSVTMNIASVSTPINQLKIVMSVYDIYDMVHSRSDHVQIPTFRQ